MMHTVCEELISKNISISVAESFTGGNVAANLVMHPGISSVFKASIVAYSDEAKNKLLGVKKETLDAVGAVSYECATQMAEGVRILMNTDIGVSTTGFAGPGGGNCDNPVGTCYIAISTKSGTIAKRFNFIGSRDDITANGLTKVFELIRNTLKEF